MWQCRNHKRLSKYPPDDPDDYKCFECLMKPQEMYDKYYRGIPRDEAPYLKKMREKTSQ